MKKLIGALICASVFLFAEPTTSFAAALTNLNGLTTSTQYFATSTAPDSSHLLIQSSNGNHAFGWDGTPWLLKQGGTGATSFATSSVLFINNGAFAEDNLQFFWDAINAILNIGGITTPSAKLGVRGSSGLGLFNLSTAGGSNAFYVAESGNVGVNTSDPKSALDVSGAIYSRLIAASSATINWGLGNVQSKTLSGNETLTFANGQAGGIYTLILKQDGTGNRTVSWPATVKWANRTAPTLTSSANGIDSVEFIYDGVDYLGSYHTNYASDTLSNNLVSYWKFDEFSGDASDSKGSNTLTNNNSTTYVAGKINNGANIVATNNNNFSIADASQSGLDLSGDFTISLWVKLSSAPATDSVFDFVSKFASSDGAYILSYRDGAGIKKIRLNLYDSNVPGINIPADWDVTLANGIWYNIAITYTAASDTAELWLNGSSQGMQPINLTGAINNSTGAFKVGTGPFATMDGVVDELGIWNRVLTVTEINQVYQRGG